MTFASTLTLSAVLGLAMVSAAQAQNYAPSVNYQQHRVAPSDNEGLFDGRSAYVNRTIRSDLPANRAATGPLDSLFPFIR